MILPYFDYGDVIYDTASQEGLDKLQRLQYKCFKICKGYNRRFNKQLLHNITKVPMLKKRRTAHINNFMYCKLSNNQWVDRREIRTRAHDAPLFKVKVPKIESYKRAVEYSGAFRWNDLPADLRNVNSYYSFIYKSCCNDLTCCSLPQLLVLSFTVC